MEDQNKHIDELFREQLGDYTEMPPASVWDALEQKLDSSQGGGAAPRRRIMPWWPLIVFMFMASSVTGYFVVKNNNHKQAPPAIQQPGVTDEGTGGGNTGGHRQVAPTDTTQSDSNQVNGNAAPAQQQQSPAPNAPDGGNDASHNSDNHAPAGNAHSGNAATPPSVGANGDANPAPAGSGARGNSSASGMHNKSGNNGNSANSSSINNDNLVTPPADKNNTAANNPAARRNDKRTTGSVPDNNPDQLQANAASKTRNAAAARRRKPAAAATDTGQPQAAGNGHDDAVSATHHPRVNGKKQAAEHATGQPSVADAMPSNAAAKSKDRTDNHKAPHQGKPAGSQAPAAVVAAGNEDETGIAVNAGNKKTQKAKPATPAAPKSKPAATPPSRDHAEGIPVANYMSQHDEEEKEKPEAAMKEEEEREEPPVKEDTTAEPTVKLLKGSDAEKEKDAEAAGGGGATASPKPKPKPDIEAGAKLGYERGISSYTAGKYVVSLYAQYNISNKFAVLLQPALKFAQTNNNASGDFRGFYDIISDNHTSIQDSAQGRWYHSYQEKYDSIVVKKTIEQAYREFDIPVILQYKLADNLALMGGLNMTIGRIIKIQEEKTNAGSYTLTYKDTTTTATPKPYTSVFQHSGNAYSTYSAGDAGNATSNPLRFGYLIGLSYTFKDRLLLDVMMQQSLSSQSYIPNKDVRSIYAQPYFRVSVGYKILKGKKDKVKE